MSLTISLDAMMADAPPLSMEFCDWIVLPNGRKQCSVILRDGVDEVRLSRYSPSPMRRGSDIKGWADDILSFIEAGRLDGEPGNDDEYADIEKACKLWAEKYESPLAED